MRGWFTRLTHRLERRIHRWLGPTRYHDQAGKVNNAGLRAHVLAQRLEVYRREGKR